MKIAPGSLVGGKYRLEHPLSQGGMGSVWLARHAKLGSPVAIKFMDPAYAASPTFVTRFEREARIAANLDSPFIVKVQDYGIDDGLPYHVMELLRGEDLGARLQRCGRLSLHEGARVLTQAGRALRRAHETGLVHRDLKPKNIFLARVDDEEIVKILDFGIVKDTGSQLGGDVSTTGEVLGSPHYMSPEQLRGDRDLDARADIWSLGVILFRCLTGQLPFPGDKLGSVIAKILVDPIPLATQLAPDLPPEIDAFFATALARDRNERFPSVREMIDELNQIAGSMSATPPGSSPSGPITWRPPIESTPAPLTASAPPPLASPFAATPALVSGNTPHPAGTITRAGLGDTGELIARKTSRGRGVLAISAVAALLGVGAFLTCSACVAAPPVSRQPP